MRNLNPPNIYLFKVNFKQVQCEICSKLTMKTPERRHWQRSGVFIVNVEAISHLFLVFLLLSLSKEILAEKRLKNDIFNQQSWEFFQSLAFRRSSRPEVFYKKAVFDNFEKFAGKHLRRSLFLIKLPA